MANPWPLDLGVHSCLLDIYVPSSLRPSAWESTLSGPTKSGGRYVVTETLPALALILNHTQELIRLVCVYWT